MTEHTFNFRRAFVRIAMVAAILLGMSASWTAGAQEIDPAKKYSFEFKSQLLPDVLRTIEKETGYIFNFVYDDANAVRITKSIKDATIDQILAAILVKNDFTYQKSGKIFSVVSNKKSSKKQSATPKKVSGYVTDLTGTSLPGVVVNVKGTDRSSITDKNGFYSMDNLLPSAVLVFSMLGMETQEIAVGDKTSINVELEMALDVLEGTVINGMFSLKANTYTGGVTTVQGEELKKMGNNNILKSLANIDPSFMQVDNLMAGSNPNALPDFQMRGASTIQSVQGEYSSSANQPLFILDGFETEITKILDLNMDQVESVTTLKDATAKAIYGAKAANGVIVIETRRPEAGRLRVTYTGEVDVETPDLSSYDLCNAEEKLKVEKLAGIYLDPNGNHMNQISLDQTYQNKLREILAGVNTDWKARPIRVGVGQKHSLYVEGGDKDMLYGVNLSYNNIEGVMKGSSRNTFSGGVTLSYRVKNFSFRNKLTIDYNSADNSPWGSFDQYCRMNPYSRLYDEKGNLIKYYTYYTGAGQASQYSNPIYNTTLNTKDNSTYTNITENFYAEWQALESLRFTARFGLVRKLTTQDIFRPANHTDFVNVSDPFLKGMYTKGNGTHTNITGDIAANYSVEVAKHLFFINAQFNIADNSYNTTTVKAQGFPNDFMDDISFAIGYEKDGKPTSVEGVSRTIGGIGSLNYSYDNRYLFDANIRYSGSSEAAKDKRWNAFWSVGGGWNIHSEGFMRDATWINRLKVRVSYGYTGNQGFSSYDALTTFGYYTNQSFNGQIGSYLKGLANNALTWQQKNDFNVGIDFDVLDNRITSRFDYYNSLTKGMVTNVTVPGTTGFNTYVANLGETENKGFEAFINGRVFQNKGGRDYINIFASVAHNINTLKKISNSLKAWNEAQDKEMIEKGTVTPSVKYYEGCSMNAIWAVKSLGIDPQYGREIFVQRDGTVTYEYDIKDQVVCGDYMPKYNGNIGINGEINGWGFSITANYRWGGQMYNTTLVEKVENAPIEYNVDRRVLTGRWQQPGDIAQFKAITDRSITYPTSRFVQDYNLLTLSNLSVYYDFRNCKFMKNCFLERLKITAYTSNLFTVSSIKVERGTSYPFARTFSLNAQITF